jgi:uroporphyrinogen-III synthase
MRGASSSSAPAPISSRPRDAVRVLVTRPEPDGERTAARLRARGCEVLLAPLLRVEFLDRAELGPGPWTTVALTSANAARAIARHPRLPELRSLPVFTVGRRTAEVARASGFTTVTSADGNVADLANLIGRGGRRFSPVLYLAGEDRVRDLAEDVADADVKVEIVTVYRAAPVERMPAPVEAALRSGEVDGVMHFSPRSVGIYLNATKAAGLLDRALAPFHYCLSQAVAAPLAAAGATRIAVAAKPDEASLVDLVASA